VLTLVLDLTGYVESTAGVEVEQSAAAVAGIIVSFSVVPAVLLAVSLISLGRYRLRRDAIEEAAAPTSRAEEAGGTDA
ncbi:MAG TPA: MFS transporter, partial [Terrimesophilobacter sp.]|nr:MFS transporter [Terrimesophilobacter sp.]